MPIIDPVCHRELDDFEYPEEEEYEGRIYYFCSLAHAQEFRHNPVKYADERLGEVPKEWSDR